MESRSLSGAIPYPQFQEYLNFHQTTMEQYVGKLKRRELKISDIEAQLPAAFQLLLTRITQILENNNVMLPEGE